MIAFFLLYSYSMYIHLLLFISKKHSIFEHMQVEKASHETVV